MSKHSRISKQLWELSVIGMMGLGLIGLEVNEGDGKQYLSGDVLLDMEAEELDYQDHREIFTGPASIADVASQFEDWDELSEGPLTAHIESVDSIREELGWSATASFDRDVPSYNLWDESWETAGSFDSAFA